MLWIGRNHPGLCCVIPSPLSIINLQEVFGECLTYAHKQSKYTVPSASFCCLHFSHTFDEHTLLFSSTNNMVGNLSNTWILKETFHWQITCPERCKSIPITIVFALARWPSSQHERVWQQTDYSLQVISKTPWINKLASYIRSENWLTL